MDSAKLVDSLTKENMNQKKKKRDLILLKYKTDSIDKQKNKSIQFNDRKAFEFTQNNKWYNSIKLYKNLKLKFISKKGKENYG